MPSGPQIGEGGGIPHPVGPRKNPTPVIACVTQDILPRGGHPRPMARPQAAQSTRPSAPAVGCAIGVRVLENFDRARCASSCVFTS